MANKHKEGLKRNGRMVGAERRRIARQTLREFYKTSDFEELPSKVRLSMLELCSREPSSQELSNMKRFNAKKATHCPEIGPVANAGEKDMEFHIDEQSFNSAAFYGGSANG
ncbi:hypothetical protein SDC9_59761 [bioreactor metagenome]|uniref:Uncharacterized protein n=1 Tax=bioreactor metagenome TaxID=1076179 RepID=A0A644XH11_9ZZZZ